MLAVMHHGPFDQRSIVADFKDNAYRLFGGCSTGFFALLAHAMCSGQVNFEKTFCRDELFVALGQKIQLDRFANDGGDDRRLFGVPLIPLFGQLLSLLSSHVRRHSGRGLTE